MRGQFTIYPEEDRELVIPNLIPDEGELAFLQMLFQGDDTIVPLVAGNYYMGLTSSNVFDESTTLATLPGELGAAGGYARKPLGRNITDWPTVDLINSDGHCASRTVTFTASGANFSDPILRVFICNVLSGGAGVLFAVGGAFPQAIQVNDGQDFPVRYDFYLR